MSQDESFAGWVRHVFDHPGTGPEWYFADEAEEWDGTPASTVRYMTRLFQSPIETLAEFQDDQINRGLWYLASNSCSDHMYALVNEAVPLQERVGCVGAFLTLFTELFAARCTPHLGHLGEEGSGALNLVCYMWWDLLPIHGIPEDPRRSEFDAKCLEVQEMMLGLDSDAVQESALHGLGHWHDHYPAAVEKIISAYLEQNKGIRPELRQYAKQAKVGTVQ